MQCRFVLRARHSETKTALHSEIPCRLVLQPRSPAGFTCSFGNSSGRWKLLRSPHRPPSPPSAYPSRGVTIMLRTAPWSGQWSPRPSGKGESGFDQVQRMLWPCRCLSTVILLRSHRWPQSARSKRIINHCGAPWPATSTATVRNTMSYTLTSAATATGLNRTTILRAIKSGKISGAKDEHGEWHIEPVELHRVYPPVARADAQTDATPRHATAEDAELRMRATLAEARLADLKSVLDDMRCQRDHWQTMAQRLAITDQRPAPTRAPSWWQRLSGMRPSREAA
jgi:hypothetical protein